MCEEDVISLFSMASVRVCVSAAFRG